MACFGWSSPLAGHFTYGGGVISSRRRIHLLLIALAVLSGILMGWGKSAASEGFTSPYTNAGKRSVTLGTPWR